MPVCRFFATAPKGIASLLADELRQLGAGDVVERAAGVAFSGDPALGYRACLWSRTASRVLLELTRFDAPSPEALYEGVQAVDWSEHLAPTGTLAVDFHAHRSQITHTHFGALKVKDAIVDQFRACHGQRPSVELEQPDVRLSVVLDRDQAVLSLDLSGESLHRRGYRIDSIAASLKQNLAAALLLRCGWPAIAAAGGAFVDPMCGSGTLGIEAAMIAGDIAPGLRRRYYGFLRWRQFDATLWENLLREADERCKAGAARPPGIHISDADPKAIAVAKQNVKESGLPPSDGGYRILIRQADLSELQRPPADTGLVLVNPPYGERMGETAELRALYTLLGEKLRQEFNGWQAAVFTGNPPLGKYLGLTARRKHTFYNGAIECQLLRFDITPASVSPTVEERAARAAERPRSPGAQMFANRLGKNLDTMGRWAAREDISCYRLYDADMPEYALAIDLYHDESGTRWVHAQEYAAPSTVDREKARQRLRDALQVLPEVLAVPRERIFLKKRERKPGKTQYEKRGEEGRFHIVREGNCRLLVNFGDYLDTGLFLDHRITRHFIGEWAKDKRFLNLFAYTGAATVHATLGGARATTSVDLSATYLDWAGRNLALNGLNLKAHELVQADCREWLRAQSKDTRRRYDLIFLDPPTFSNSKRMEGTLDIQRDHVELIRNALALLAPGGTLLFSTNRQKFKLDASSLAGVKIEDLSRATLPHDFARNPHIHQCWKMTVP